MTKARELLAAALDNFAAARDRAVHRDAAHTLGGRLVRFSFAGDGFAEIFARTLAGRIAGALSEGEPAAPVALTVHAWDGESGAAPVVSESWRGQRLGPLGIREDLSDGRYHVSMDVHGALLSILDTTDRVAVLYAPDTTLLPYWEHAHPARTMFAAWARSEGLVMCHAAAAGPDDGSVLLVGPSGSGKSTTALSCRRAGMHYAGDDYVLVHPGPPAVVHPLYTSALLEVEHARRHPGLMPAVDRVATAPSRTKAVMFGPNDGSGAPDEPQRIAAIAAPRVVPSLAAPRYSRLTAGAALRALAPSTLTQLGTVDASTLARLTRLCRDLPCYELELGGDVAAVPAVVAEIAADAVRVRAAGTTAR